MRFSLATLLWCFAVIAAFLVGYTAQSLVDPLMPITVAARDRDARNIVQFDDFDVVYVRRSSLPTGGVVDPHQIEGKVTTKELIAGKFVYVNDFFDVENVRSKFPSGWSEFDVRIPTS